MASKFDTLTDLLETPMGKLLTEVEFPKPLRRGDVLEVEIVKIDPEGFLVDSGHKSDALVPLRETRSMSNDEVSEIKIGDKLSLDNLTFKISQEKSDFEQIQFEDLIGSVAKFFIAKDNVIKSKYINKIND